ncbi:hypothetical protein Pmani_019032 [Petrolisthes manimaculis]|uniref:Lipocalin/cytosolic fatty-acid binding domain-containing protein n=1 Tax=Petrolisthes manimaculis TaxID=1843537 RepID=A0AAE1PLN4_9EUCA|nr:hypothetical protein Pmani_019032 [Petrolisthes manimaculis]
MGVKAHVVVVGGGGGRSSSNSLMGVVVVVIVALLLLLLTSTASGFIFRTGKCRSFPSQSNFKPRQFDGVWYVVQMTNTATRCYSLTFRDNTVDFRKEVWGPGVGGLHHALSFTATTRTTNNDPSQITLTLPTGGFGEVALQVMETDYQTYALMAACKLALFGHIGAVIIAAREPQLPRETLDELRVSLSELEVDLENLSTVQHTDCLTGKGIILLQGSSMQ